MYNLITKYIFVFNAIGLKLATHDFGTTLAPLGAFFFF
jgi:hypothetical protein